MKERVKAEEPLSRHATWGIGGPAEAFIEIHTRQELLDIVSVVPATPSTVFYFGMGLQRAVARRRIARRGRAAAWRFRIDPF